MEAPLSILHLEDEPLDTELVQNLLHREGLDAEIERVDTLSAFQEALERGGHNLILSDYTVPGVDTLEALRWVRQTHPEVGFIFVSGTIGEDRAIDALRLGASDYVLKQRMERLGPAVRRSLREAQEQSLRRQAEEALQGKEARLNGIISSAMDGIISINAEQRIVLFNPAAERLFGVTAAEALGSSIDRFIPERFRALHNQHVKGFGETGTTSRKMGALGILSALRTNGEEFPIEASISQVQVGKEKLFTVILRDITERKRAEEVLARGREELERLVQERTVQLVEANTNLQTFAYTAAHDLRSPLRTIKSFSNIVLEDYGTKLDAEGQSLLERMMQSAGQMEQLLDDLLEYSEISAAELKLEPISLRDAVGKALALLEADIRSKDAVITLGEPLPGIVGHPVTIVLLIYNLVSNALKFVAPAVQPAIRIWAQRCSADDKAEPSAHSVRLWVEDNGIGISSEGVEKLFGAFQRLHGKGEYPGTGLGLAIVKKGAERMGGRVGVESEPGVGSRFWVELKAASL